ncbi:hydrogenase large subunit [Acidisoma sp. 7E03]
MSREAWQAAGAALAAGQSTLLSVWGEPGQVHVALLDEAQHLHLHALACPNGRYPSLGRLHAPAMLLERATADLWSLEAEGLPDPRPWLRHEGTYAFLPVEGAHLHVVPVGPVHAGIIEPGHFRFTCDGETIARLEIRLGYAHKGVDRLWHGASLDRGAQLAGRRSGDSTVAYAWGFAAAVEAALDIVVPPRALWLRAVMAELERLANHLGDVGSICNDAAFAIMLAHCSVLREQVLRAADFCFGHRLMMDRIRPGGVTADLDEAGVARLTALVQETRRRFRPLVALYEKTASVQDRTLGTGVLSSALAARFGAGGVVGRASGRSFDARRDRPYAPYDQLEFTVPVMSQGDVHARIWVRVEEVEQSLRLLEQMLRQMPSGTIITPLPQSDATEGTALIEGFRGDVFAWVRLDAEGRLDACHLRDPSWFHWPLLEAAIEGNIIADFPLCNKSFNCAYSGVDL